MDWISPGSSGYLVETLNTMGTLIGAHPILPWTPWKVKPLTYVNRRDVWKIQHVQWWLFTLHKKGTHCAMWTDVPLSVISLFFSFSYGRSWEKKTTRNLAYASKLLRWNRWTLPEQQPSRLGDIASIGVPWVTAFKANSFI